MDTRIVLRAFGIGVTSGLRSMTGPAVARWRAGDAARLAIAGLAAGELIADKLPAAPPRTIPPALIFRILAGGFAGASVSGAHRSDRSAGALLGSLGAVAGSYAGLFLRTAIVKKTGLPDFLVALAEDVLAVGGGDRRFATLRLLTTVEL